MSIYDSLSTGKIRSVPNCSHLLGRNAFLEVPKKLLIFLSTFESLQSKKKMTLPKVPHIWDFGAFSSKFPKLKL
jgi:hypothetical protein